MALSNQELLNELSAKPIMEIVELVKMLEETWGVSAAAPVAVAAAARQAVVPGHLRAYGHAQRRLWAADGRRAGA